ncbi:MAG TPA: dual specificity protein phosphatase 23 [Chloroflexota bacterium]|nr:dual specificity protein phosphatase 23 [Chloroflexota bacterium]
MADSDSAALRRENVWLKRTLGAGRQTGFQTYDLLSQVLYETGVAADIREASDESLLERGYLPEQIGILRSALVVLRGFSWVLRGQLAGCARPHIAASCVALAEQGVRVVMTLTEEPLPEQWVRAAGLEAVHVPVVDMGAPTSEQLARAVGAIDESLGAGKPVAVHCLGGIGRTGTVLAAYLVHRGLGADEAITTIRRLRNPSIETAEQEEAVRDFARGRATPG